MAIVLFLAPIVLFATPVRATQPRPTAQPAVKPVRNVILFIADGYRDGHWRAARTADATGFLALDRMPVTGIALPPAGVDDYSDERLGAVLGTGRSGNGDAYQVPLLTLARQYGRRVALVSGRTVTDPLPGAFVVSVGREDDGDVLRRIAEARVDVLFGREGSGLAEALATAGYRISTDARSLLLEETMPAAAVASSENVPFDTLTFRALHLVAKGSRGLMMAVAARPDSVSAAELDAAVATAVAFARRDGRTLVVVASRPDGAALNLYAFGQGSEKFSGTIAATDVPKIVAGLAGLKVFRRDFSPLFAARSQPEPAALPFQAGKGRRSPLPW